jgi:acetyl esterase
MSSHHHNPRSVLNAATRTLIDRVQRAGRPPLHAMTAPQARVFYDIGGPICYASAPVAAALA